MKCPWLRLSRCWTGRLSVPWWSQSSCILLCVPHSRPLVVLPADRAGGRRWLSQIRRDLSRLRHEAVHDALCKAQSRGSARAVYELRCVAQKLKQIVDLKECRPKVVNNVSQGRSHGWESQLTVQVFRRPDSREQILILMRLITCYQSVGFSLSLAVTALSGPRIHNPNSARIKRLNCLTRITITTTTGLVNISECN